MESGNETKDTHDIVIDPREMEVQINNNNDDNSEVANIKNKNMNDVPCCSKIVTEKKEPRDKDCTDDDNSKSIEMERGRKLETDLQKMKILNVIMNMFVIRIYF